MAELFPTDSSGELLPAEVLEAIRARLPEVATATIAAVTTEVPGYRGTLDAAEQVTLERAVELALGGFLTLAASGTDADPSIPFRAAIEGADALGRGEARRGRPMDALLAAYRVGARIAWRGLAGAAAGAGLDAGSLVRLAELVFAYIDQLSAASVAGHAEELEAADRVRQRRMEALAHALLTGGAPESIVREAEGLDWRPPETLCAVLARRSVARSMRSRLDQRTLLPDQDVPGVPADHAVLLVPDGRGRDGAISPALERAAATVALDASPIVGPARPWLRVRDSLDRAARAWLLVSSGVAGSASPTRTVSPTASGEVRRVCVDVDDLLPELVVSADSTALADLRDRALAPLSGLRPTTAERLAETLRSWLLHQGRRDAVAADLFVHPQTVRYRMSQIRELFGDRLEDPRAVLELVVALTMPQPTDAGDAEA